MLGKKGGYYFPKAVNRRPANRYPARRGGFWGAKNRRARPPPGTPRAWRPFFFGFCPRRRPTRPRQSSWGPAARRKNKNGGGAAAEAMVFKAFWAQQSSERRMSCWSSKSNSACELFCGFIKKASFLPFSF